jgi:HAE1 family hydrophobic/amphiphilic exporter-1
MTTLTTVLAMVPMAVATTEGSEVQAPLARVVIGGLTTSTLITLVVIPCVYLLSEQAWEWLIRVRVEPARTFARRQTPDSAE